MPRMMALRFLSCLAAAGIGLGLEPAYAAQSGAGPLGGFWLWVLEGQRELTNAMTLAVRQIQTGDMLSSGIILATVSFIYGVLHAVGPGHGKFVISSYALANERTVRRGILLSFMAAFVQAISAVVIVAILAVVLQATSTQLRATEGWLETASWGLIALLGAWLLYRQVKPLLARWSGPAGSRHVHHHDHSPDDPCCGHVHIAAPSQLGESGPGRGRGP